MRKVFYTYNPETDDFERYYPSVASRMRNLAVKTAVAAAGALVLYGLYIVLFGNSYTEGLKEENAELKEQYSLLDSRLEQALKVMEDLRKRDDNFYRVMMQMDPVGDTRRFAGLDHEENYRRIRRLSDSRIVDEVSQNMELLESEIYSQSKSFDELRSQLQTERQRLAHTPQIFPIDVENANLASGFGYRRSPGSGETRFHRGIDYAVASGTPVYATAAGEIKETGQNNQAGKYVLIDHGYDCQTLYCHLNQISVKEGDEVKIGANIGKTGNSGRSLGPHLHYEVIVKEEPQNPVDYFFAELTADKYKELQKQADNTGYIMDSY